jgi:hypothetical protein
MTQSTERSNYNDFSPFVTGCCSQNIQQKKLKHDLETHVRSKRLHDSVENLTQKGQAG